HTPGAAPVTNDDDVEEQRYLGRLLDRLETLRAETRTRLDHVLRGSGGTPQARSERESFARLYSGELAAYNAANLGLYFGRLDMEDGEVRHIGRVGLRDDDEEGTPLLLDWRAEHSRPLQPAKTARPEATNRPPALPLRLDCRAEHSRPSYLATTARPEGTHRRRHLRTVGRRVIGVHDEYLSAPADGNLPSGHEDVVGESALLEALDSARSSHMTD